MLIATVNLAINQVTPLVAAIFLRWPGNSPPLPPRTPDWPVWTVIGEVQKCVTYWTGVYDCMFFIMNRKLYNSLSSELQKIVDECGLKGVQNQHKLVREDNQKVLEKWEEAGIEITHLTEEVAEEFRYLL